ncbi:hypothetical protein [Herbaspirillum sp. RV1423]|uniref:hypothetical protein n=1 Tax=Herbaspirillum sp. RV1423 TaxID=1443993 RepID=UPI0012DCB03E|nr:hypothetical protein [Herbaspirillum sp. RV1423]
MDKYTVQDENFLNAGAAGWYATGGDVHAGHSDMVGMTTLADDFPWHRIRRLHRK